MIRLLKSFGAFGVVLISAVLSGLVLLKNDLEACTQPANNITPGGCTIHWSLIGADFMTAMISGLVHYLSMTFTDHDLQIASLQTATGTMPAGPATAVVQAPAPVVEQALVPAASTATAEPAAVIPPAPSIPKENLPS